MSGIRIENLNKAFGLYKAVDNASFTVKEGELSVLLGPSGSGKSTVLRIIAGLEMPDSGHIYLTGKNVTQQSVQNRNIGFVFQHYALFKHMTVEKNIAFGMTVGGTGLRFPDGMTGMNGMSGMRRKARKQEIKRRVAELIDLVKLEGYEKHYPSQLSGGQRQRVALARALAPQPRILLLDEPFGALDAKVRENLAEWLRNLHKRVAITTVLVTHDQQEAIEIADKIIVINRGRVEQTGTPREVYEHPRSKFVASFVGQTNVLTAMVDNNTLHLGSTSIPLQNGSIPPNGSVVLLVRPEDVILSHNTAADTAADTTADTTADTLKGCVQSIHYRGNIFEIDVSLTDQSLKVTLSKQDYLRLNLSKGESVGVAFRDYRYFNAPEGESEIRRKLSHLGYIE